MSKPEWGVKRLCPSCSALYYDMKKNPPVCPKCSTAFDPEALLKSRRRVSPDEAAKKKAAAAVEEVEEVEVEEEVEADDAAVVADDEDDEDVELDVEVEDDK
jgi:uncharacterized protein (TIGR02300 family)